jgi:AraC-like DNA-binding protein
LATSIKYNGHEEKSLIRKNDSSYFYCYSGFRIHFLYKDIVTGAWLSWLERRVHIAEIAGSIPAAPIFYETKGSLRTASMSIIRAIVGVLVLLQFSIADLPQRKSPSGVHGCVAFEAPRYGSIVKGSTCTLSISACPEVESIHLSACFYQGNGMTDTILDLGTISQPPFKLIWNISDVPNQLFRGMWFLADAHNKNGTRQLLRQDGVFLYTRPVINAGIVLPPLIDQQKLFFVDTLPSAGSPMILDVLGSWNAQGLHFTVLVMDPSFTMTLASEKLADLGVIVGIDPFFTKSAYPQETSIIISFPLMNKPVQFIYKKKDEPRDGLRFSIDTVTFPNPATIKTAEGKGYGLDISIPKSIFKEEMPESISCNILIKVLDRFGQISTLSTNRVANNEALCPLLWMTMKRHPTGLFNNAFYVFLMCFGVGFVFAFFTGYFIWPKRGKTIPFNKLDLSEAEKQIAKMVYGHLEQNITNKDLTLPEASRELSISGSKLDSLIKKYNGLSFKKYVMQARVEIAKERLRSSHASETSIAESCGFKSIVEMEKSFMKYCRTTPFRYRRDNQVA